MCDVRSLDDYLVKVLNRIGPAKLKAPPMKEYTTLADKIWAIENEMLMQASLKCRTTREAAKFLGISQPSVVRKFKNHGISITKNQL